MAIREIIEAPDSRLKVVSEPVDAVDDDLRRLMDDMLATMYEAPGVGLSAVQVGVAKQVIVVDVAREGEAPAPVYLINPEFTWYSDETVVLSEGCLSLPEHFADVERPERVKLGYIDYDGKPQEMAADGLLSRCIQHEYDHLDGILFVDHISALKRNMILRKLVKLQRQKASA
jgi:peptide deformylase